MKKNILNLFHAALLCLIPGPLCQAQLATKATGEAKIDATGGAGSGGATTAGIEERVKSLQESIKKATDRLQNAGKSQSEKIKDLDNLAQTVGASLKEVSPNGGLHNELRKAIETTEAKAKGYHDKAISPNISAQTQLKYRELENRFSKSKDDLYRGLMALEAQRVDLEKKLTEVKENKELIADLLAANDLEDANKAVLDVVKNMGALNQSFDGLLKNITSTGVPEKTQ